jgi:rubrerythrin
MMVTTQQNIKICKNCGNVYSEKSIKNPWACPVCGNRYGEEIHLM